MFNRRSAILLVVILLACSLSGCFGDRYVPALMDAEGLVVDSMPDSAAKILERIPRSQLGKKEGALYALIEAEIEYRKYIYSQNDSALRLAARIFEADDDRERLMRTKFQMSLKEYYARDYAEGVLSATEALDLARELDDHLYIARSSEHIATIYNNNYNHEDALPYTELAIEEYGKASRERNAQYAEIARACILRNMGQADYALQVLDSLSACSTSFPPDSSMICYGAYAKLDILCEKKDKTRIPEIVDTLRRFSPSFWPLDVRYILQGEVAGGNLGEAERIVRMMESYPDEWKNDARVLQGHIDYYKSTGQTDSVIKYSDKLIEGQQSGIRRVFNGGLQRAQVRSLAEKFREVEARHNRVRSISIIVIVFLLLTLLMALYIFRVRVRRQKEIMDSKMDVASELFREKNTMVEKLSNQLAKKDSGLAKLLKERVELINHLCDIYFSEKGVTDKIRAKIYRDVCAELNKLDDDDLLVYVEDFLNETKDNIVKKLDSIPGINMPMRKVAIYSILGVSPRGIAHILDCSLSSAYTRRTRLMGAIMASDSKYSEELKKEICMRDHLKEGKKSKKGAGESM